MLSLGAEIIANDKPIVVRYDGEWFFPVFKRYPETAFGGEFPLQANYKSPYIQELIAEKDGWMIWPVIPFNYSSINYELRCRRRHRLRWKTGWAPTTRAATCWRVIYGFRISVLFAITLTPDQLRDRRDRRALQGFWRGWTWSGSACWRSGLPGLPADHSRQLCAAQLLVAAGHHAAVLLDESGGRGACRIPARTQPEYVRAARALGMQNGAIMFRHILPNAMVSTMTFMPFILTGPSAPSPPWTSSVSACRQARRRWASWSPRARPTCRRPGSASAPSWCWRSC